jgi:hypothetical protein
MGVKHAGVQLEVLEVGQGCPRKRVVWCDANAGAGGNLVVQRRIEDNPGLGSVSIGRAWVDPRHDHPCPECVWADWAVPGEVIVDAITDAEAKLVVAGVSGGGDAVWRRRCGCLHPLGLLLRGHRS